LGRRELRPQSAQRDRPDQQPRRAARQRRPPHDLGGLAPVHIKTSEAPDQKVGGLTRLACPVKPGGTETYSVHQSSSFPCVSPFAPAGRGTPFPAGRVTGAAAGALSTAGLTGAGATAGSIDGICMPS